MWPSCTYNWFPVSYLESIAGKNSINCRYIPCIIFLSHKTPQVSVRNFGHFFAKEVWKQQQKENLTKVTFCLCGQEAEWDPRAAFEEADVSEIILEKAKEGDGGGGHFQCDQMAKLSLQYWAISNHENLSNVIKICPIRVNILPNTK